MSFNTNHRALIDVNRALGDGNEPLAIITPLGLFDIVIFRGGPSPRKNFTTRRGLIVIDRFGVHPFFIKFFIGSGENSPTGTLHKVDEEMKIVDTQQHTAQHLVLLH